MKGLVTEPGEYRYRYRGCWLVGWREWRGLVGWLVSVPGDYRGGWLVSYSTRRVCMGLVG